MRRPDDHPTDFAADAPAEPLDSAVAALRDQTADPEAVRRAADRVWRRLEREAPAAAAPAALPTVGAGQPGRIVGCEGVRALLPAFAAGELPEPRALLVEDHVRECIGCRRALAAVRRGASDTPLAAPAAADPGAAGAAGLRRWLPLAAALAVALGLAGWLGARGVFAPTAEPATVESIDGSLLRVAAGGGSPALAPGAVVDLSEALRTAKGSTAVLRLADGSRVELAERTELAVAGGWRGTTLELARGNVIVEAAEQRWPRHLYVATGDCRVSVVGTVFAVDHGVGGSRVAVIEGEVRVAQGGRPERVLGPGDQVATRGLGTVPVSQQFAWSGDADRYLEMLGELRALRREIAERVPPPGLRAAGRLLDAVPATTAVYAALPNLGRPLADGYAVFREQLADSPRLAEWWAAHVEGGDADRRLDELVTRLRDLGDYLGDEVVVAVAPGAVADPDGDAGRPGGPLLLAEVVGPGFDAYLAQEIERINTEAGHPVVELVADPAVPGDAGGALQVWTGDGLLIASPDRRALAAGVAAARGEAPGFAGTELYRRVGGAYADGAEWLLGADLGALFADLGAHDPETGNGLSEAGLADARYLIVEHRGDAQSSATTATLGFAGPRHGVASWLAAPGPIGSLDYVSPDASFAAAFLVKNPIEMVDDLARIAAGDGAEGWLAEIESDTGLDPRDDLAAALGGEVAFALDGPIAPQPSWKLVAEVYDPARLQAAVEAAVGRIDAELRARGEGGLALDSSHNRGRTFWRLGRIAPAGGAAADAAWWVYDDGFLIAAPSAGLLERTLDRKAAGATLPASVGFRRLLPDDPRTGYSALVYQDLASVVAPIAGELSRLGEGGGEDGPGGLAALAAMSRDGGPTLLAAWAGSDQIELAAHGPGGPFGLGGGGPLGLGGLEMLAAVLGGRAG